MLYCKYINSYKSSKEHLHLITLRQRKLGNDDIRFVNDHFSIICIISLKHEAKAGLVL